MTLDGFQKWVDAKCDGISCFSDDGGMSLDHKGLESLLLQAFLLGQGAACDTVTLLTEQHERIEEISRKLDGVNDKMRRPHPETVVDTIAEALTALCSRVDNLEVGFSSHASEAHARYRDILASTQQLRNWMNGGAAA